MVFENKPAFPCRQSVSLFEHCFCGWATRMPYPSTLLFKPVGSVSEGVVHRRPWLTWTNIRRSNIWVDQMFLRRRRFRMHLFFCVPARLIIKKNGEKLKRWDSVGWILWSEQILCGGCLTLHVRFTAFSGAECLDSLFCLLISFKCSVECSGVKRHCSSNIA